jgi:hypothetical protein
MTLPNLRRHIQKVEQFVKEIPSQAHTKFVSETPIDTGNARRSTDLRGNEIQGNYPYATRLNEGYSTQARDGMTEPTVEFIREQLRGLG